MSEHPDAATAAAYALDALDPADHAAVTAHLSGCAACRTDVAEVAATVHRLALAAPDAAPPEALRRRVLADARLVRPLGAGPGTPRRPAPWLAIAAGLALLGLTSALFLRNRARERDLESALAAAQTRLEVQSDALAALEGPRLHQVALAAPGQAAAVRVFWNHGRQRFVVFAFDLTPPPAGRTWQLWAIADGQAPVSMGTFTSDSTGRALLVLPVTTAIEALGLIRLCGLTEEPAGGSATPSEAPRLVGVWAHAD